MTGQLIDTAHLWAATFDVEPTGTEPAFTKEEIIALQDFIIDTRDFALNPDVGAALPPKLKLEHDRLTEKAEQIEQMIAGALERGGNRTQ
jgi:hypothetical protein